MTVYYLSTDADDTSRVAGASDDALWGDAGSDVIFGGDGSDIIYGGPGADTIYGGAGSPSELMAFPGFNGNPDGALMDSSGDDLVQVEPIGDTMDRLQVIDSGEPVGGPVDFHRHDIDVIALFNNDAAGDVPVVQYFAWDGTGYTQLA